jgi:hypothetical protein
VTIESLPISLDPSFEVTPPEENQWAQAEEEARTASDYVKLGVLLGAGFMVWRYMVKEQMPILAEPNNLTIREALENVTRRVTPIWMRSTVPAFERAYEIGSHGGLDEEEISYLATVYAKEMEGYVNETSASALLEGFNALVNRKWSPQIAYRRALEGFGLTSDGMKTYIMSMENLNTDYLPNALTEDPRVNSVLTKLLGQRSLSIGENEAYTAQEMGRQIMWMRAAEVGLIPKESRRMWRTAKDERVCPTCAPMNEEIVGLYDKFNVKGNEYWNPILHPNCRCWVELIEPEELSKAYDPMRTPRGGNPKNKGQFSRSWGSRANVKNKDVDPIVDQIIADALKATKEGQSTSVFGAAPLGGAMSSSLISSPFGEDYSSPLGSSTVKESSSPLGEKTSPWKAASPIASLQSPVERVAQIKIYMQGLADNAFPWIEELHQPGSPPPEQPRTLYSFGWDRDFETLTPEELRKTPVNLAGNQAAFTGDQDVALSLADASWYTLSGLVGELVETDPFYRELWVREYYRPRIDVALSKYTPEEIKDLQAIFNIADEDDEDLVKGNLANAIEKEVLGMEVRALRGEDDEQQAKRVGLVYAPPDDNYVGDAYQEALRQAAEEILDDPDPHWPDRLSFVIEDNAALPFPMDEEGNYLVGRPPVPTVYEITDAVDAEALPRYFRKSGSFTADEEKVPQFRVLGDYVVDGVRRDYHDQNQKWDFPYVQIVTLVPKPSGVSKALDPFGVVHLGVK